MIKKLSVFSTAVAVTFMLIFSAFSASAADGYKSWLQSDSRWGSKTLGGSGDTMAKIGCAVTSVAIQIVHSGSKSESEFNPGTLVDYLNKSGGLGSEGDLYWDSVSGYVSTFKHEKRAYTSTRTQSGITKEITDYINAGYYIVLSVEYDNHWVAIDRVENGVVYMMDPAQNKTNVLFDYYSASGMPQMRLFKGKNAPGKTPSTGTNPTPSTTYLTGHYKTTDSLNLRASYSTSSTSQLVIPSGKTLVVTRVYGNWGETEYNDKDGWICLDYATYTEGSYKYNTGTYKCNVSSGVNMRSGVGSDKSKVCIVPYNANVTVSSVTNNWGKSTYGSYTGYICMEYLTYVPATTAAVTTVTTKATTTTTKATTTTTKATTTTTKDTTTTTKAPTTTVTTAPSSPTTTVPTSSAPAITAVQLIRGDVNRDGKIDRDDVLALIKYINAPKVLGVADKYAHDVNNDSVINDIDIVYLMKKIKNQVR